MTAALWRDVRIRSAVTQIAIAAAALALGAALVGNVIENLARLGINAGFQFLARPAGFGIVQSLVEYSEASSYGRALLVALLNTVVLSAAGILIATIVGFIIGLARLSTNLLISNLALAYIEIMRNVPLLLQIFFWYFAVLRPLPPPRNSIAVGGVAFLSNRGFYLPAPVFETGAGIVAAVATAGLGTAIGLVLWARRRQRATGRRVRVGWPALGLVLVLPALAAAATGFPVSWDVPKLAGFNFMGGIVVIPEFVAMLLSLSIYSAAFIAEIVRAGVLAVPTGQVEAARSLGLKKRQITRFVVVPQALRVIVPPLTSQYLNLVKNSSLAAAIAYLNFAPFSS